MANYLQKHETKKIEIYGHTDNTGTDELNNKLSKDRANSVANYLLNQGIDKPRITTLGFGSSKPIMPNTTTMGKAKNRRIEIKLY